MVFEGEIKIKWVLTVAFYNEVLIGVEKIIPFTTHALSEIKQDWYRHSLGKNVWERQQKVFVNPEALFNDSSWNLFLRCLH